MHNNVPYISFTFDDFPCSALHSGGAILKRFGLRATYYASFGLMGTESPTGTIFSPNDIIELLSEGHEVGCHTFSHCNAWYTKIKLFEDSIIRNKRALEELIPGATLRSFSYPITGPRPESKRVAGNYFHCSRGGGQTFNVDIVDLNLLKAYFLEKSKGDQHIVEEIIDLNCIANGWLIFATHDISNNPTRFGCTPSFFENVVKYSIESGTRILPVIEVLDEII